MTSHLLGSNVEIYLFYYSRAYGMIGTKTRKRELLHVELLFISRTIVPSKIYIALVKEIEANVIY